MTVDVARPPRASASERLPASLPACDRWTYRPELDGLRSVAVYLVVLFHCGVGPFDGGFIGVDLFFVLSGFLVSHVIWAEVDRSGSFRLGLVLRPAGTTAAAGGGAGHRRRRPRSSSSSPARRSAAAMVRDAQSALVYLSNWHFIADSPRLLRGRRGAGASPFLHFWSLSIEEQFYVVLPLALLLLLRLRRHAVVVAARADRRRRRLGGPPGLVRRLPTRRTPTTPPRRGSTSWPPGCCSRWSPGW